MITSIYLFFIKESHFLHLNLFLSNFFFLKIDEILVFGFFGCVDVSSLAFKGVHVPVVLLEGLVDLLLDLLFHLEVHVDFVDSDYGGKQH